MAKQKPQSPPDLSIEPTHDNLFKFTYHREDGVDDLSRELFKIAFDEATNNEFNWPTLDMDSSSLIDQTGRERFADLIFSVHTKEDNSATKFIFLLEHKSASDSNALMQLLGYQTSLYLREGKQCRVLPMIIYNGKKSHWSAPLEFQQSLQPVSDHLQREWGGYFLNFRCKMVNLHEVIAQGLATGMDSEVVLYALSKVWDADEGTFEKVFRLAAGLSDEKRNRLLPMVVNYLQSHLTPSKRISYETIAQIEEQTLPKRKRSMLSFFDEIKNEGIEQGLEQGMEQGLEQGMEQGLEQGMEQGLEQGLKKGVKEGEKKALEKIAENLIRDGMEIRKICQYTGMSHKQVEQIQNNLQRH